MEPTTTKSKKPFTQWQLAIIGWVWIVIIPLGVWKGFELLFLFFRFILGG